MEWLNTIMGALLALFAGLNIFQLLSFRQYKKKYTAEAEKEEAEASEAKQTALERRLAAVEKLYEEQGKVIDDLRNQVLQLSKEKFDSATRIVQLEGENKMLKEKVEALDQTVQAYKTLVEKNASPEFKF